MGLARCRHCGGHDDVHGGECAQCRTLGHRPDRSPRLAAPHIEPPHDRPWVARSAFTGRTRRSPRA